MLGYSLWLAVRSIRSTPGIAFLTVIAIGLGIAVPTTLLSVHHVFARNPIPDKSERLFNVRMDSWDPSSEFFDIRPGDPPKHITYQDMERLLPSDIPVHRTGVATATIFVFPDAPGARPYQTRIQLCHADFFPMFDAPFQYGSGWSRTSDERRDRVVVLSREANQKLFGGVDSVGRNVRLGDHEYTVVGVLAEWEPTPRFYDIINNAFGATREFHVPFDLIREQELGLVQVGDTDSWGTAGGGNDPDAFFTQSETTWIQYWVELPPDRVAAYRDFVDAYTREQKALGRFPRPINNRVTPLMEWMSVRDVVPDDLVGVVVIALLFLVVCSLNLMGLLLGKFLAASGRVGVHRALGASRRQVFVQRLLECEVVGLLGGVVGLALTGLAMVGLNRMMPLAGNFRELFRLDGFTLFVAVVLALAAGVVAGLYPAWRACRVPPAMQLKVQ